MGAEIAPETRLGSKSSGPGSKRPNSSLGHHQSLGRSCPASGPQFLYMENGKLCLDAPEPPTPALLFFNTHTKNPTAFPASFANLGGAQDETHRPAWSLWPLQQTSPRLFLNQPQFPSCHSHQFSSRGRKTPDRGYLSSEHSQRRSQPWKFRGRTSPASTAYVLALGTRRERGLPEPHMSMLHCLSKQCISTKPMLRVRSDHRAQRPVPPSQTLDSAFGGIGHFSGLQHPLLP